MLSYDVFLVTLTVYFDINRKSVWNERPGGEGGPTISDVLDNYIEYFRFLAFPFSGPLK